MVDGTKHGYGQKIVGLIVFFAEYGQIMENINLPHRYFGYLFCGYFYWEVECVKIL